MPHRLSIQPFKLRSFHPNLSPPQSVLVTQSRLTLCESWTVPVSMGFSRQEYWSGLPFPSPGNLPNPGIEPASPEAPASEGGFFTTSATWETPSSPITWSNIPQLWAPALSLSSEPIPWLKCQTTAHICALTLTVPDEFEVLDVSLWKKSARDKLIGRKWVYLEKNTLHRVWALSES